MRQKRVAIHGEASYVKSGYGGITRNLAAKLHEAGHIVAEISNYGHIDYPLKKTIPWEHYAVGPGEVWNQIPNERENAEYNSTPLNHFGLWRMNDILLHFKPDVVISFLDHWMSAHILHNPMKHCFKMIWSPTVDARPQNEQWIADYIECDHVYTYTDFAQEELRKESGNLINLKGLASPGVNNTIFSPIHNKKQFKKAHGLDPNVRVLGTVMRNQRRKLYPDLLLGFRKFLDISGDDGNNVILYLHTSYPDLGWDLPRLIKETGLSHKILFTYLCLNCGASFPSFFADAVTVCPNCQNASARLPNTQNGISDEALAIIYNLFDIYVQYANSEGIGMPAVEAASCGVHPMYVDYSGMEDFVKLGGTPIKYSSLYRESETHCLRAVPDNDDFANKLLELVKLPDSMLMKKGFDARRGAIKHYTWDGTAKKLLDSIEELDGNWTCPARIHRLDFNEPPHLSDKDFVVWAITNLLGEPNKVNSYFATILLRDLSMGLSPNYNDIYINEDSILGARQRLSQFGRKEIKEKLVKMSEERNLWEARRCGFDKSYTTPSWLLKSVQK